MIEQTRECMQKMKFNGMLETLDLRIHEATTAGWSYSDFIGALVTDEKHHRDNKAIKRRIKGAMFRTDACLDKIDYTAKRSLSKKLVCELKTLRFFSDSRNILLIGPTGVGKTFLATAIGNHACHEGYKVTFMGVNLLMEEIAMSRATGKFLRLRDRLIKTDLLILDDLGIKPLSSGVIQDLYDILEERYQKYPTVITTQLPLINWKEVIDDPVALEAIVDRLIHGAIQIDLTGESYRKKIGKEKMN